MVIRAFPPVDYADRTGLLAIGGDCEAESLILAYRSGIFPWEGEPLMWFAPPKRAVLFLKDFHVPTSLRRTIRKRQFEIRWNSDFRSVMLGCAQATNRHGGQGTWITDELIEGYCELFNRGQAYSVEAFQDNRLVGGVYGVRINKMISAESMFYIEPNASKVALVNLVERFKAEDIEWIDCQAINPFTKSLGVREIRRDLFMRMLGKALE